MKQTKSNTNFKLATGAATVIAALGATGYVKADDVASQEPTTPVVTATTEATQEPVVQPVTEADVAQATQTSNAAETAYQNQSAVTTNAQTELNTAQEVLNTKESDVATTTQAMKEATPENIQAAKADIPVKEDVVKTAEAKITPAENKAETTAKELQEAQAKDAQAKSEVSSKEKALQSAKTNQGKAEEKLATATTNKEAAKANKAAAEKTVATNTEKVAQAQTVLDAARSSEAEKAKKIDAATQKVETAKGDLKVAENNLQSAVQGKANAETALDEAKTAVSSATDELRKSFAKVLVPKDYDNSDEVREAKNKDFLAMQSKYVPSEADKKHIIDDVNDISSADLLELNKFAIRTLEDIREQYRKHIAENPTVTDEYGTYKRAIPATPVLTEKSMDFANAVAKNYVADKFDTSVESGHDFNAINKAASEFGLKQFGKTNQNENLATKQHLTKWATMAQLKSYVYGAFIDFLYNGKEYFHADSILHTGIYNNGKHKSEYDGVAFSHINGFVNVHVLRSYDDRNVTANGFGDNVIDYATGKTAAETALNNAVTTQSAKEEAVKEADKAVLAATEDVVAKQEKVTAAQSELDALNDGISAIPVAQAKLQEAKDELARSEKALADAIENVKATTEKESSAKDALSFAKGLVISLEADLAKAQENSAKTGIALEKATTKNQEAQKELEQVRASLAKAQKDLSDAKTKLEMLVQSKERHAEAVKALEVAKAVVKNLSAKLEKEQEKLAELKTVFDEAKAEKERVIAEYKKQHPEVVPSSPEVIVDEAIKTQGHSELKDYIVGVGVQAGKTFATQGQGKSALEKATTQNKELPKTGDASLASTIIGLTMVTLGFGLKGKKKD